MRAGVNERGTDEDGDGGEGHDFSNLPVCGAWGIMPVVRGVAQLGLERTVRVREVGGSNPLSPTTLSRSRNFKAFPIVFRHPLSGNLSLTSFAFHSIRQLRLKSI